MAAPPYYDKLYKPGESSRQPNGAHHYAPPQASAADHRAGTTAAPLHPLALGSSSNGNSTGANARAYPPNAHRQGAHDPDNPYGEREDVAAALNGAGPRRSLDTHRLRQAAGRFVGNAIGQTFPSLLPHATAAAAAAENGAREEQYAFSTTLRRGEQVDQLECIDADRAAGLTLRACAASYHT